MQIAAYCKRTHRNERKNEIKAVIFYFQMGRKKRVYIGILQTESGCSPIRKNSRKKKKYFFFKKISVFVLQIKKIVSPLQHQSNDKRFLEY